MQEFEGMRLGAVAEEFGRRKTSSQASMTRAPYTWLFAIDSKPIEARLAKLSELASERMLLSFLK